MNLHELKIWIKGFSSAIGKTPGNNPLNKEQWVIVQQMIMEATDASTEERKLPEILKEAE